MNKIKFSHWYNKMPDCLKNGDTVTLLEVFCKDFKDLSKDFIWYDALKRNSHNLYPLPSKGPAIILLFIYHDQVFTTVRPYTPIKEKYYSDSRGMKFEVVVNSM